MLENDWRESFGRVTVNSAGRLRLLFVICVLFWYHFDFLSFYALIGASEAGSFEVVNPLIDGQIGELISFGLEGQALLCNLRNKQCPIEHSLRQAILLLKFFLPFFHQPLKPLNNECKLSCIEALVIEHLDDQLHVKAKLLLGGHIVSIRMRVLLILVFFRSVFCFDQGSQRQAGREILVEDTGQEVEEVYGEIGELEEVIWLHSRCAQLGHAAAHMVSEVLFVAQAAANDDLCNLQMEQFLLDFGVDEYLVADY